MCKIHGMIILRHFPFVFTLQRIFRRLQVNILLTPEIVKRHSPGQQRSIFNCSLQLQLTVDSGTPRRWCGICPNLSHLVVINNNICGATMCRLQGMSNLSNMVWRKRMSEYIS